MQSKNFISTLLIIIALLVLGILFFRFLDETAISPGTFSFPFLPAKDSQKTEVTQEAQTVPYTSEQITKQPLQAESGGSFERTFSWSYAERKWSLGMKFYPAVYGSYKERSRFREYDLFASDPYDDELVKSIADALKKLGVENGLSAEEIPSLAASFVQSLPYTPDAVTTSFDEYPRFPYETLYDDGGDCEDTSVLTAAILQELGYGVALVVFSDHIGVGVQCSADVSGTAYSHNGKRYCYLETTGENWEIGQLPDEYKGKSVQIVPIYKRPFLTLKFSAEYRYNFFNTFVDVNTTITNLGSETAKNTKLYVALQAQDTSKVWDSIESEPLQIKPEGTIDYHVENLHAPGGETFRIYVRAFGENIVSDELTSEWVKIK